jgi:PEP-CTERM motif
MTIYRVGRTPGEWGWVVRRLNRGIVFGLAAVLLMQTHASALQLVTLNFDSTSLADPADEYVYSPAERVAIKGILEEIYLSDPLDPSGGPFGIKFEILDPLSPPIPFTTSFINFNNGFMGGSAEKLDFRNTDGDDDADVNALGLLKAFDGSAKAGGGTWTLPELTSGPAVVRASANLAAHEFGHAMGLRHHDSFGPIGSGISVSGTAYEPVYLGPGAPNTPFHVMGLASTVALSADNLVTPSWLSERSAMKLTFNVASAVDPEVGVLHDVPALAQPIPFSPVSVANTHLAPPDPYYPDPVDLTPLTEFDGFTGGIIGATLTGAFADDYYSFFATAGMAVTIEAVSKVIFDTDPTRLPDPVDMVIELIDSTLSPVPYPVASPFTVNDDQFESTDSILFDVIIPADGIYYIEVTTSGKPGGDITGEYELYVMGFLPPPPPFLAGDLNEDGFVGVDDLNIVLVNWNLTVTAGDLLSGDPDGNGFVGIDDLNIVLVNWNAGTPPPANAVIPEPATILLMGLSGVAGLARHRHR